VGQGIDPLVRGEPPGRPTPGDVAGFGPVAAADGRALADRLASVQGSRWCVTLTGKDGRAVAHGCAQARQRIRGDSAGTGGDRIGISGSG